MDKVILDIDKETKDIYLNILRNLLENQENWKVLSSYHNQYYSPKISEDSSVYFMTPYSNTSFINSKIDIKDGNNNILYTLKISWWDFKTRRLLNKLHMFMQVKDEWTEFRKKDEILRKSLGSNMDRFLKLSKIRKKLE